MKAVARREEIRKYLQAHQTGYTAELCRHGLSVFIDCGSTTERIVQELRAGGTKVILV